MPILVDFWAAWCGPCRMAAPEVKRLAHDVSGQALVLKVDTEANCNLASRFRIQSIPRFLILQNGQVIFQRSGVAPHTEMRRWLTEATAAAH